MISLLKGNEPRAVGGTNTGPTVLYEFVGHGELPQVVTDHLRLDFNLETNKPH